MRGRGAGEAGRAQHDAVDTYRVAIGLQCFAHVGMLLNSKAPLPRKVRGSGEVQPSFVSFNDGWPYQMYARQVAESPASTPWKAARSRRRISAGGVPANASA